MKTAVEVIRALENAGFEAYMVGGAVRDLLLGKAPDDFDVATNASPVEVKQVFSKTIDTGIAHGTVLVRLNGEGIEVTTFRTDGTYTDNRRPDSVEFVHSLEEDLKRRDFTINAMAMAEDFRIIDPFGGKEDLESRVIRAVGNPDQRFQEDALRMLRAVRFSSQLDFSIEAGTLASIKRQAKLIRTIAVERIKNEIDKIFLTAHAKRSMDYLASSLLTEHLPAGNLFKIDWTEFSPQADALYGWAYLLYWQEKTAAEVSLYKFSNEEKRILKNTLAAARREQWDEWTIYSYSEKELTMAAALLKKEMAIAEQKRRLPIRSKTDMAASGNDLMQWSGTKQGPWLKEWIEKMERQIVYGLLQNDKEKIKDWFINEYYRHA
ncbi:CCA tRNA nucleotidyltransferase [Planococcus sp. YIM B11945]|uniref:CCA tRNA nucleotidyltransferase n=1 Tax=Planococcus sp. YIM B11945 TaxID=3435410 RepID=UPI003D7C75F8